MLYRNLFVWVVHKGFSFFHGFVFYIRQHGCSWINYAANLRNIAEPCAWSADFYHLSRNAYRSNDLRDKMLQSTIPRTMRCFDDCRACKVLVQTYKNISGGGGWTPLILSWIRPYKRMLRHPSALKKKAICRLSKQKELRLRWWYED